MMSHILILLAHGVRLMMAVIWNIFRWDKQQWPKGIAVYSMHKRAQFMIQQ